MQRANVMEQTLATALRAQQQAQVLNFYFSIVRVKKKGIDRNARVQNGLL